MKTIFLFLFSWLGYSLVGYAQSTEAISPKSCTLEEADSLTTLYQSQGDLRTAIPFIERGIVLVGEPDTFSKDYLKRLSLAANLNYYLAMPKETETAIKREEAFVLKTKGKECVEYIDILFHYVMLYNQLEKLKIAEEMIWEAIQLSRKLEQTQTTQYGSLLNGMAVINKKLGNLEVAEDFYLQAIDLQIKSGKEGALATFYQNLAKLYELMSRQAEAEPLYLKALEISARNPTEGKKSVIYATILTNLAGLYSVSNRHQQALPLIQESLQIYESTNNTAAPTYGSTLNRLSEVQLALQQPDQAIQNSQKALAVLEKTVGKNSIDYSTGLQNLANIYLRAGKEAEAERTFLQALASADQNIGISNPQTLLIVDDLLHLYRKRGDQATFEKMLINGLHRNTQGQLDTARWQTDLQRFYETADFSYKYCAISGLLFLHEWHQEQRKSHPTDSLALLQSNAKTLEWSRAFAQKVYQDFALENDKIRTMNQLLPIAHKAVEVNYQLYQNNPQESYVRSAFAFMEQNKATLLSGHIRSGAAAQFGQLPDSLIEKEKRLATELSQLKRKIAEEKNAETLKQWKAKEHEINQAILDYKKMIETTYPDFFKLKYSFSETDLKQVQSLLDAETALIEYLISNDGAVFAMVIKKDQVAFLKLAEKSAKISPLVDSLRKQLTDYEAIGQKKIPQLARDYYHAAYPVYEQIFAPLESHLAAIRSLIIIPDGIFNTIPFEALIYQPYSEDILLKTNLADFAYLLNKYEISYNYSAGLFQENKNAPRKQNNNKVLAMAADYAPPAAQDSSKRASVTRSPYLSHLRNVLLPLPAAQKEVELLEALFQGTFLKGVEANEAKFKALAPEYSVLHLAMHGILNKNQPILSSLAFTENLDSVEDNFLQAHEISRLALQANLVVLSACETGYGKFEKGEGVMSLARSFMYAGVPALVVSLWEINDVSTARIMEQFYQNLAQQQRKSQALQQAKIAYLKGEKGLAAHPAYWSPLVQLGDDAPIELSGKKNYWLWGGIAGGVAVLMGIGFWMRRKRG